MFNIFNIDLVDIDRLLPKYLCLTDIKCLGTAVQVPQPSPFVDLPRSYFTN